MGGNTAKLAPEGGGRPRIGKPGTLDVSPPGGQDDFRLPPRPLSSQQPMPRHEIKRLPPVRTENNQTIPKLTSSAGRESSSWHSPSAEQSVYGAAAFKSSPHEHDARGEAMSLAVQIKGIRAQLMSLELANAKNLSLCRDCLDDRCLIKPGFEQQYWTARARLAAQSDPYLQRKNFLAQMKETERLIEEANEALQQGQVQAALNKYDYALNKGASVRQHCRVTASLGEIKPELESGIMQLVNCAAFKQQNSAGQNQLLNLFLKQDEAHSSYFLQLVSSPNFAMLGNSGNGLSVEQQQLLQIFRATQAYALPSLCRLLREHYGQGQYKPPLILDRDLASGKTLLTHLAEITAKLEQDRYVQGLEIPCVNGRGGIPQDILSGIIIELDSYDLNIQGDRGVCPAAHFAWFMCRKYPAETARILSGLLEPDAGPDYVDRRSHVLLRSGHMLTRAPGSLSNDSSRRSTSERLIQSALMDLANGFRADYLNPVDSHFDQVTKSYLGTGLTASETRHMVAATLAVPQLAIFRSGEIRLSNDEGKEWAYESKDTSGGPDMIVYALEHYAKPESIDKGGIPRLAMVSLQWSDSPDSKHTYHALGVDMVSIERATDGKILGGRVYMRNPWGCDLARWADGEELSSPNPPVRIENGQRGRCSMSLDEFKKRVQWALVTISPKEGEEELARHHLTVSPYR